LNSHHHGCNHHQKLSVTSWTAWTHSTNRQDWTSRSQWVPRAGSPASLCFLQRCRTRSPLTPNPHTQHEGKASLGHKYRWCGASLPSLRPGHCVATTRQPACQMACRLDERGRPCRSRIASCFPTLAVITAPEPSASRGSEQSSCSSCRQNGRRDPPALAAAARGTLGSRTGAARGCRERP